VFLPEASRLMNVFRICLLLLLLLTTSAPGQETGFVPVWIDNQAVLEDDVVEGFVDQVEAKNSSPDHIVVLVHGFATPRASSTRQYTLLSERIRNEFAKHNQSVEIVGVQWHSKIEGIIFALPGEYKKKTVLARKVGRFGVRHLLLKLKERFPDSNLNIMAHSMGCEVTAAAMNSHMEFDEVTNSIGAYSPDSRLKLNGAALCGSDLDYDVTTRGHNQQLSIDGGKVLYLTLSQALGHRRDKVLELRSIIRGRALGSAFPRMTEKQYDNVLSKQMLILDNTNIPLSHSFVKYYDEWRLSQIIPTLIYYSSPDSMEPPPNVAIVQEVMSAPNTMEDLLPFVESDNISSMIYAMWRLEHLNCGGSQHLADGYLEGLVKTLRSTPRKVRRDQADSSCQTVKRELFPTEIMFERAGAPSWAHR
jgi:hypothetical protein